ncbi:MAG TPA: arginase family protein [Candidatus Limnocylindrales bacterium]
MGDRGDETRKGTQGDRPEPVGPPNALVVPRFAGPDTFARLPRLDQLGTTAVAVVGVFILRGLHGLDLAGADVVEVSPAWNHAELTDLAAANVAYEFLGLFALAARTG